MARDGIVGQLKPLLRAPAIRLLGAAERVRRPWVRRALKRQVRMLRRRGEPVRLVIGAGPTRYDGWLATDLPVFDALKASDWDALFQLHDIDRVLSEHVVEHWTEEQFRHFLRTSRPYLSERGRLRLAVPDGSHPDSNYIEWVRPGGSGQGADGHKVLWTFDKLAGLLSQEGYAVEPLEYFDERGEFHSAPWSPEDGFVMRSADHDSRNRQRPLTYTSLIVDVFPR